MSADTRKDKRAPVSLKVRFKSATVDEFIEQYSVDISTGGLFIKTKSPMPIGTLLKFEFQLKDESRLIHGVGRVVWRRDEEQAKGSDIPAGMGIKFIKMDPESRALVDKIIASRGEAPSSYDMVEPAPERDSVPEIADSAITIRPAAPPPGTEDHMRPIGGIVTPTAPAPVPLAATPRAAQRFKDTLQFGAGHLMPPAPPTPSEPPPPAPDDAFFPPEKTDPALDAEPTVVRSAAQVREEAELARTARTAKLPVVKDEPEEDEDAGRVTMPETDARRMARLLANSKADQERAALRAAAEEEARAERRAAAQRADAPAPAPTVAFSDMVEELPDSIPAPAPFFDPPLNMMSIPVPATPSAMPEMIEAPSMPPLEFEAPVEAAKEPEPPVVAAPRIEDSGENDVADVVSLPPPRAVSDAPRGGKKKKKKRGGSTPPQQQQQQQAQRAPTPAAAPAQSSASQTKPGMGLAKIPAEKAPTAGPRLPAGAGVAAPKKATSSKTLPIILTVVALAVAAGVVFWQVQPEHPATTPPPAENIQPTPSATPTPPTTPPTPSEAAGTPTPANAAPANPTAEVAPQPTPEPAISTVPVRIESTPSSASILVEEEARGVTPTTVDLPLGVAATVTVSAPGYAPLSREVVGRSGAAPIRFQLVPAQYTIIVDTTPLGGRVTVNGRTATAPAAIPLGRVSGPVSVSATKPGFETTTESVPLDSFTLESGVMVRRITLALRPGATPAPPEPVVAAPEPARSNTSRRNNRRNNTPATTTPGGTTPAATTQPAPEPRPAPEPHPAPAEPIPDNPF